MVAGSFFVFRLGHKAACDCGLDNVAICHRLTEKVMGGDISDANQIASGVIGPPDIHDAPDIFDFPPRRDEPGSDREAGFGCHVSGFLSVSRRGVVIAGPVAGGQAGKWGYFDFFVGLGGFWGWFGAVGFGVWCRLGLVWFGAG
jgi:hypothetical protein